MALLTITHFWSNLLAWRYQHNFPIWGLGVPTQFSNLGVPAQFSNLGVPTQFSNLGVPAQFSNLGVPTQFSNLEVPTQFVRMGVPAQFSNLGVPAHFWSISLVHIFLYNFMDYRKLIGFIYAWLRYGTNQWRVKPRHQSESRLFAIERSEMSERRAPSKDGDWGFTLNVSIGAEKRSNESRLFAIECSEKSERRAPSVDLLAGIVNERSK